MDDTNQILPRKEKLLENVFKFEFIGSYGCMFFVKHLLAD